MAEADTRNAPLSAMPLFAEQVGTLRVATQSAGVRSPPFFHSQQDGFEALAERRK